MFDARKLTYPISGLRSKNNNVFVFNSYWRTWSRVLNQRCTRSELNTVEVNLTPVNPLVVNNWIDQIEPIIIRSHVTDTSPDGVFVGTLPYEVIIRMEQVLDPALIDRLLHEDFLPQIDWTKYRQHNNGGAKFDLICK